MQENLAVTYRVVLDDGGLSKAVGLQTHFLARAIVPLVKENVQDAIVYCTSAFAVPVLGSSVILTTSNQSIMPSGRKKLIMKSALMLDDFLFIGTKEEYYRVFITSKNNIWLIAGEVSHGSFKLL